MPRVRLDFLRDHDKRSLREESKRWGGYGKDQIIEPEAIPELPEGVAR